MYLAQYITIQKEIQYVGKNSVILIFLIFIRIVRKNCNFMKMYCIITVQYFKNTVENSQITKKTANLSGKTCNFTDIN